MKKNVWDALMYKLAEEIVLGNTDPVLKERERCAKIAEEYGDEGKLIAMLIREGN